MQKGDLVKSLKGRDKDSIYMVTQIDKSVVFLANGRNRKVENPKKKNAKHLQVVGHAEDFIESDLFIRKYCKI